MSQNVPMVNEDIDLTDIVFASLFSALSGVAFFLSSLGVFPGQKDPALSFFVGIAFFLIAFLITRQTTINSERRS